jgi:hypothetical protein
MKTVLVEQMGYAAFANNICRSKAENNLETPRKGGPINFGSRI